MLTLLAADAFMQTEQLVIATTTTAATSTSTATSTAATAIRSCVHVWVGWEGQVGRWCVSVGVVHYSLHFIHKLQRKVCTHKISRSDIGRLAGIRLKFVEMS